MNVSKTVNKFIEKIEGKYKKQVPRNTIYREALILLENYEVSVTS